MSATTEPKPRGRPVLQPILMWIGVAILVPVTFALAATLIRGRPLPWQFHMPWVSPHILAALMALALGVMQFALKKGDRRHRLVGYGWCAVMAFIAVSGLQVQLVPGHVTLIHRISSLFAVADLILLPIVIWSARTGRRRLHRSAVLWSFANVLNAGLLAFIPQRAIGALIIGLFH
jgi:uncharacterized membrane protein